MNELKTDSAILSFVLTIKRKETGLTEIYNMVGYLPQEINKTLENK